MEMIDFECIALPPASLHYGLELPGALPSVQGLGDSVIVVR